MAIVVVDVAVADC